MSMGVGVGGGLGGGGGVGGGVWKYAIACVNHFQDSDRYVQ